MSIRQFLSIIWSWKLTFDGVGLLEHIRKCRLEGQDWYFRYFRFTPVLLENVRTCSRSIEDKCEAFSLAVSWFRLGDTYKLTSRDRTLLADEAILSYVSKSGSSALMEAGSSDGIASLQLLKKRELFSRIVLSDRFNIFFQKKGVGYTVFYGADKKALTLKVGFLSFDLSPLEISGTGELETIETINPLLLEGGYAQRIEQFNIFMDVFPNAYGIIKCSNLLNSSYFSDAEIRSAVKSLSKSLVDDGYLVVSQNNDKYSGGEAMFVLHKMSGKLTVVESINEHDIVHLFE